jgi:hypothetical protein
MLDEDKLVDTLTRIGELLVRGDYAGVSDLTGGRRLAADEMRAAVADYGRTLVSPPAGRFAPRSVVEIKDSTPQQWSVYVDLWTVEEGRSDLTLEVTVTDTPRPLYDVTVDNLHVL